MTSSCSFLNFFKEDARRRIWLYLLSAYLYLSYIIDYTLAQSGQVLLLGDDRLGPGNKTIFLITVFLAVICAFQGFGYLFSEEKTDFYLSLPLKRNQIFLAGYLNGFFIAGIPCLCSRLICYFMEGSRSPGALYVTWMGILVNILGFLFLYNLTLCIILLTGHILIAGAGTILLFFYGTIVFGLVMDKFSSAFFDTYYKMDVMSFLTVYVSPYKLYGAFCGTDSIDDVEGWLMTGHLSQLRAVLILAAVTFVLVSLLFKNRPAEAAGRALAFDKTRLIIKFLLAAPAALMIGYYIMLCSLSSRSFLLLAAGIIFGAFTVNGLMEILFQFDIRGMLSEKKHFLIISVLCLVTAGSFYTDVWGYDNYLPDSSEIVSAAAVIHGLDDSSYSKNAPSDFTQSGADLPLSSMQLKEEDKTNLLSWITNVRHKSQDTENPLTYVLAAYKKADGQTAYRKYPITSIKEIEAFRDIYTSSAYKKGAFSAIDRKSTGLRHYVWSNGIQKHHLDLTGEENEKLLKLLTSDLINLEITTLKQEFPIGTLSLVYGSSDYGEDAPLYPGFTKTLNYLETLGIPARKTIADYEVTQIQIYEKQEEMSILGKTSVSRKLILDTTDEKTIHTLTTCLIPEEYAVNPILNPAASNYQAIVSCKDTTGRTVRYLTMLPTSEALIPEKP